MALETVTVRVLTDDLVPVALDDVVVRVFDATGTTLITSGTTGDVVAGEAEFTLNGTASPTPTIYQLRFYAEGVSIVSPQNISVYSPPAGAPSGTNIFAISAHVHTLPEATDPLLCRASAYFVWPDGRPNKGLRMHFIARGRPQVLGTRGVLGERVTIITDALGYAAIDLIRGACYDVMITSEENTTRSVLVPDVAAVHLQKLLFPRVEVITWAVATSMVTGTSQTIYPVLTTSAFNTLEGTAPDDVLYESSNPAVLSVLLEQDRVTLSALTAGTAVLTATRKDTSIEYAPSTDITNGSITITVS